MTCHCVSFNVRKRRGGTEGEIREVVLRRRESWGRERQRAKASNAERENRRERERENEARQGESE